MRIEDLDEFEGLTADMVRDWLRAKGLLILDGRTWAHPKKPKPYYWDSQLLTDGVLGGLACDYGMSVQALLSEINPRMRPGWPTDEELQRHAWWLVHTPDRLPHVRSSADLMACRQVATDSELMCWPCDSHGNKVRRGTVPA